MGWSYATTHHRRFAPKRWVLSPSRANPSYQLETKDDRPKTEKPQGVVLAPTGLLAAVSPTWALRAPIEQSACRAPTLRGRKQMIKTPGGTFGHL
jgi:hypothetical protein